MGQLEQGRKLLGPGLDAGGRHVGLLVPLEHGRGAVEVGDLRQDLLQVGQCACRAVSFVAQTCRYSPE
jgi:hypothetical protein